MKKVSHTPGGVDSHKMISITLVKEGFLQDLCIRPTDKLSSERFYHVLCVCDTSPACSSEAEETSLLIRKLLSQSQTEENSRNVSGTGTETKTVLQNHTYIRLIFIVLTLESVKHTLSVSLQLNAETVLR